MFGGGCALPNRSLTRSAIADFNPLRLSSKQVRVWLNSILIRRSPAGYKATPLLSSSRNHERYTHGEANEGSKHSAG